MLSPRTSGTGGVGPQSTYGDVFQGFSTNREKPWSRSARGTYYMHESRTPYGFSCLSPHGMLLGRFSPQLDQFHQHFGSLYHFFQADPFQR